MGCVRVGCNAKSNTIGTRCNVLFKSLEKFTLNCGREELELIVVVFSVVMLYVA